MESLQPQNKKRILLVEGPDDYHVVKQICEQKNQKSNTKLCDVDECNPSDPVTSKTTSCTRVLSVPRRKTPGKQSLLSEIKVRLKESDIFALGILIDADNDLNSSWQSITHRLQESEYPDIPEKPDRNGTIILPPETTSQQQPYNAAPSLLPRVGIWIMPDNQLNGTLEDFLKFLVPEGDPLLPYAEKTLNDLPDTRFTSPHRPKALMHTWLAWQNEPGKPYGQAISARYLDTDLPMAKTFANWLRRTFFDD